jgi:hypothetical protein
MGEDDLRTVNGLVDLVIDHLELSSTAWALLDHNTLPLTRGTFVHAHVPSACAHHGCVYWYYGPVVGV